MANAGGVCCVLGGGGFVGTVLVEKLCQSGRSVLVVGRRNAPLSLPKGAHYVRADIGDRVALRKIFASVSEVVDLAYGSVPKTSFDDPVADIMENLPMTVAMMEELACSQVARFVYVSSGGTVYGEANSLPIDESHTARPISPYGVTKLASERYADLYRVCRDVPTIIARPANAYGELQEGNIGQGFVATATWRYLQGLPVTVFGTRGTIRDYIHVDDIAEALIAMLDFGLVGDTYNIGTGIGTDNLQILEMLGRFARDSDISVPDTIICDARPFDVTANILDSRKLSTASGWNPKVALENGIERCWIHALKRAREFAHTAIHTD